MEAITLQSDGKIVVAGVASHLATQQDFGVARYNTDGSLDSTFGSGGTVSTDFSAGGDIPYALQIQPDGDLLVAGEAFIAGNIDFGMAEYTPTGLLDTTFGSGGKVSQLFATTAASLFAIAFQADGKVVGGGVVNNTATASDFGLARYLIGPATTPTPTPTLTPTPTPKPTPTPNQQICLKDDTTGNVLTFNVTTGAYEFTQCSGGKFTFGGTGTVQLVNSVQTLTDSRTTSKVSAGFNKGTLTGSATLNISVAPGVWQTFRISDTRSKGLGCTCGT